MADVPGVGYVPDQIQPGLNPHDVAGNMSPEALAALFLSPMYGSKPDTTGQRTTGFDVFDTDKMGRDPKTNQLKNQGWLASSYDPLAKSVNVERLGWRGIDPKPPETTIGDKREIIRALQRAYPEAEKITGYRAPPNTSGARPPLVSIPLTPGVRAHAPQMLPGGSPPFGMPGTKITDLW